MRCFDKAIALDKEYVHAWCLKAEILQSLDRHEEALSIFRKARELSDCPTLLRHEAYSLAVLHRMEEALDTINLSVQHDNTDALSWELKGRILSDMGRSTEALGCMEKALTLDPNLVVGLADKGVILVRLGSGFIKEALECFEKAIQLDPDDEELWFNKGKLLHAQEKLEDSMSCFNRAVDLNPEFSCAYCARGILRSELRDNSRALDDFNTALSLGLPIGCCDFYAVRASIFVDLGKLEDALKDVTKGLEIDSKKTVLLASKALILTKLGKPGEAKEYVEAVIQSQPTSAQELNNVAYLLYELAQPRRALDYANSALEKEQNNTQYLDTLACILSKLGRNDDSLVYFEKALKLRKHDGQITWSELADLYDKMGRKDDAKEIRQKHGNA